MNAKSEKKELNNYEKTLLRAEGEFLTFDQEEIIAACGYDADENYIYVTFFYAPYRIDRKTGHVEAIEANGNFRPATFNEGMSIFDVSCEPTPYRCLSGEFVDVSYFSNVGFGSGGSDMFRLYCELFLEEEQRFREVSEGLGAKPFPHCDVGYVYDVFPFLPFVIQLWEGEEGIPPAMRFLWDRNTKDYLRFETMFYAIGHILKALTTAIGGEKAAAVLKNTP